MVGIVTLFVTVDVENNYEYGVTTCIQMTECMYGVLRAVQHCSEPGFETDISPYSGYRAER